MEAREEEEEEERGEEDGWEGGKAHSRSRHARTKPGCSENHPSSIRTSTNIVLVSICSNFRRRRRRKSNLLVDVCCRLQVCMDTYPRTYVLMFPYTMV